MLCHASSREVTNKEEALAHAARIGYPLLLKASEGGGGKGIRRVDTKPRNQRHFDTIEGGRNQCQNRSCRHLQ